MSVCTVCLAGNLKMYSIQNVELENVFEKLTNLKAREACVCYACAGRLRRCGGFAAAARRSARLLSRLLSQGLQATDETLSTLGLERGVLSVSSPHSMHSETVFHSDLQLPEPSVEPPLKQEPSDHSPPLHDAKLKLEAELLQHGHTHPQADGTDTLHIPTAEDKGSPTLQPRSKRTRGKLKHTTEGTRYPTEVDVTEESTEDNSLITPTARSKQTCGKLKHTTDDGSYIHTTEVDGTEDKSLAIPKARSKRKLKQEEKKLKVKVDFICEFCKKAFKRKNELVVHIRTHTGERPFRCDACLKGFHSASNLAAHRATHVPLRDRPRLFACARCGNSFARKEHLRLHAQIHAERKYVCQLCGKAFAMPTRLKNHLRTHSEERAHACDRCAKTFKTAGVLREHLRAHAGARPHACAACSKTFVRRFELTLHARVHSGEKPFACRLCGKAFSQSGSLRTHTRTHSTERPFKCAICDASFKDKYTLGKHAAGHAGGPPCACAVCGREYSSARSAQAHERSHARPPVPCAACGKAFGSPSLLRRHQRNVRCARPTDG